MLTPMIGAIIFDVVERQETLIGFVACDATPAIMIEGFSSHSQVESPLLFP
jgi:hypothetical protein